MIDTYAWKIEGHYFATIELVKSSVKLTYSSWTVKPTIKIERHDYVCWEVPNGTILEAYLICIYGKADHL
jgi:hypothetical protein